MSDSLVRLQPDSTGKKIQTFQNSIGGNDVEAQAVVLVGTDGTQAVQAVTWTTESGDGSVDSGATSVTFVSSADFVGKILDTNFPANSAISYDASPGKTLATFAYVVTTGTLSIAKVV